MHEHSLAKEIWPQLQQIAASKGLVRVTCVEMTVGMLHGVSADFLEHSLGHAFEGTGFEGAVVNITVVDPGQEYDLPGTDDPQTANGWELLISKMEGE